MICAISSFIRLHSLLREYSAELEFDRLSSDAMPFQPTNLSAKFGEKVIKVEADSFSNLSVIFADIAGFTSLSKRISPGHLVEVLNEVFNEADKCAKSHGLERVKTIGDCYMAVAGGILSKTAGAAQAVDFAEAYVNAFSKIPAIGQLGLSVRVGIHTGPAVGGMIGSQRLTYDYWGETVNLASRLEGCAPLNGFATSEATYLQVSGRFPEAHWDDLEIRGVGLTKVFCHVF